MMDFVYALLIALIPTFFALILSKRNNWFHGIIVFITWTHFLILLVGLCQSYIPAGIFAELEDTMMTGLCMNDVFVTLLKKISFLEPLLTGPNGKWIDLAIFGGVYLISQIISSAIASGQRKKIRKLKKKAARA